MVEEKFKIALRNAGVVEFTPSYDRVNKFYTVIKVTTQEVADKFLDEAMKLKIKVKASLYSDSTDIWVFKAYN